MRPLAAAGWLLLSILSFAGMTLCVRRAAVSLPWHEIAFARAGLGALFIYLGGRAAGVSLRVVNSTGQWRRTIAGTLAMGFSFFALSRLPVGDAVTLSSLGPIFMVLASQRLLGERPTLSVWAGVVLGFGGVASIAGVQLALGPAQVLAAAAGVVGAAFAAAAMLFLRRLGSESPEAVALHFAVWSAVAMGLAGLGRHVWPTPEGLLLLLGAGVSGALGQVTLTRAYANDEAARLGALSYLGIAVNVGLGALVLGEIPGARQLLGAKLVLVAGVVTMLGTASRARQQRRLATSR